MPPDVLAALCAPDALAAIADAARELAAGRDELRVLSALRRAHPPEVAAAILTQARLRGKAVAKLGPRAAGMLLLEDSLQQASRPAVARLRAARLRAHGVTHLTDAGAGIGADTIEYAAAGLRVTAIERDPVVAALLRHNVRGLDVTVVEGDALEHLPATGAVYFDPARRAGGRRIFDPEACAPPLSALVAAHEHGLAVVAKMSPSLDLAQVPAGWDADWVSAQTEQGRSVVEAALWSPPLGSGVRSARVLRQDDVATLRGPMPRAGTPAGAPGPQPPAAAPLGRYVYEPDGAVNQAELADVLAADLDAVRIEPRIAYLTGDRAVDTPLAHRYEVIERLPWSKRAVARLLSSYDASDLVVKKRGVRVDPTALRKELLPRLRTRHGDPLVLILLPYAGAELAVLARG
ncbi:class I SAM-dependent methyltransferase [Cumulibacter manganitolerans]|uniref:class I SAM-dependent methyltransferase n=1 Tax=Cumulibacter manganitolerans TaxID=1884992 RepID=UPI0012981539|nr:class I SAM-dependent methyltransferase [Cumulibacter manganitolerans]